MPRVQRAVVALLLPLCLLSAQSVALAHEFTHLGKTGTPAMQMHGGEKRVLTGCEACVVCAELAAAISLPIVARLGGEHARSLPDRSIAHNQPIDAPRRRGHDPPARALTA